MYKLNEDQSFKFIFFKKSYFNIQLFYLYKLKKKMKKIKQQQVNPKRFYLTCFSNKQEQKQNQFFFSTNLSWKNSENDKNRRNLLSTRESFQSRPSFQSFAYGSIIEIPQCSEKQNQAGIQEARQQVSSFKNELQNFKTQFLQKAKQNKQKMEKALSYIRQLSSRNNYARRQDKKGTQQNATHHEKQLHAEQRKRKMAHVRTRSQNVDVCRF